MRGWVKPKPPRGRPFPSRPSLSFPPRPLRPPPPPVPSFAVGKNGGRAKRKKEKIVSLSRSHALYLYCISFRVRPARGTRRCPFRQRNAPVGHDYWAPSCARWPSPPPARRNASTAGCTSRPSPRPVPRSGSTSYSTPASRRTRSSVRSPPARTRSTWFPPTVLPFPAPAKWRSPPGPPPPLSSTSPRGRAPSSSRPSRRRAETSTLTTVPRNRSPTPRLTTSRRGRTTCCCERPGA